MTKKEFSKFSIQDIPEFQRFQKSNPQRQTIDSLNAAMMYGHAIHWASILDILWPDFEKLDYKKIEIAYIITRDPDKDVLYPSFHMYLASMIAMFWRMQLEQKYPSGEWTVSIDDDPEITLEVKIYSRGDGQ